MFLLVDSHQHTFANRSHVKYEFTNTKKLVKKLARIEGSSICLQQFANMFADCFCAVHTHKLEFSNPSLPTLVCRVKAALKHSFTFVAIYAEGYSILTETSTKVFKSVTTIFFISYKVYYPSVEFYGISAKETGENSLSVLVY